MRATEFLQTLWGERPPGLCQLWTRENKASHYLLSPLGADIIAHHGRADCYTAVCLAAEDHGRKQRAKAHQAIAVAGLWLDIDVNGGPDSKQGCAPDKSAARALSEALHAPTLVVDSGYGLHAWWLLDEPWRFDTIAEQQQAAQASAQWYALHRTVAQGWGWTVDHTHDLARLLRVPGTVNGKDRDNPRPVEVIDTGGPRYPRARLLALAAEAGPVSYGNLAADPGGQQQARHIVARAVAQPPAKTDVLAFNSPEFAAALRHEGRAHWTLSEWDLSLASQAAGAGWTDQEIADLIGWHRNQWDDRQGKGARADYLRRTISRARSRADQDRAALTLEQLAGIAA